MTKLAQAAKILRDYCNDRGRHCIGCEIIPNGQFCCPYNFKIDDGGDIQDMRKTDMTDEEKKAVEAVLTLSRYCEEKGEDCQDCIFSGKHSVECTLHWQPAHYQIPASVMRKYQDSI